MLLKGYFVSLLLLVLLHGRSMGSGPIKLTSESICYWTNTSYDEECDKIKKSRQIEIVHFRNDSASGVVIAEVELPPKSCNYAWFHVELVVKEETSGVNYCGDVHSWKSYRRIMCESDNCADVCGKLTKFTFYHVRSGTYYLKVKAYMMGVYHNYESQSVKIVTDYHDLWGTEIMEERRPCILRHMVHFHFTFTTPISLVQINLNDANKNSVSELLLDSSNAEKITGVLCSYNAPEKAKTLLVTYPNENTCDNETRFKNIPNVICLCWKNSPYELLRIQEGKPETNYKSLFISLLALFGFLVGLISVIIVIRKFRRRRIVRYFHQDGTSLGLSTPILAGNIEILLLYPRDCPQFMKLMKSLKIYLETSYQVQVHDWYNNYTKEIVKDPLEWFQSLIARTGLRIIVITTECGCLLQKAHYSKIKDIYLQPEYHDNYFMNGLLHIKRDFSRDVYQKVYVVQISDFSDDVELKFIPTSLTRYKLPDHFDKLVSDMSIIRSDVFFIEMEGRSAYEDFMKSLKDLKLFKKENEKYLFQLLSLQEQ